MLVVCAREDRGAYEELMSHLAPMVRNRQFRILPDAFNALPGSIYRPDFEGADVIVVIASVNTDWQELEAAARAPGGLVPVKWGTFLYESCPLKNFRPVCSDTPLSRFGKDERANIWCMDVIRSMATVPRRRSTGDWKKLRDILRQFDAVDLEFAFRDAGLPVTRIYWQASRDTVISKVLEELKASGREPTRRFWTELLERFPENDILRQVAATI